MESHDQINHVQDFGLNPNSATEARLIVRVKTSPPPRPCVGIQARSITSPPITTTLHVSYGLPKPPDSKEAGYVAVTLVGASDSLLRYMVCTQRVRRFTSHRPDRMKEISHDRTLSYTRNQSSADPVQSNTLAPAAPPASLRPNCAIRRSAHGSG